MARSGLTERRKAETRLAISQVALDLFRRDGYANVTAERIAEESGVSLRTFYRYFAAKDEVLVPMIDQRLQWLVDFLNARPADESLAVSLQRAGDQRRAMNEQEQRQPLIKLLLATPDLARRLGAARMLEQALVPVIRQRLDSSASETQIQFTAAVMVAALRARISLVMGGEPPPSLEDLGELLLSWVAQIF